MTSTDLTDVDLTSNDLYRSGFPHEVFTELRRSEPVRWQPFAEGFPGNHDPGFWVLSRHEDIQLANRDTELFSAIDGPQLAIRPEMVGNMIVSMDGREHTRLRKLISAGFTPRMVRMLDEQTRGWAASIIDGALERGSCNFVDEVAYQLPMNMIADILGIPAEDRSELFSLVVDFVEGGNPDHGLSTEDHEVIQIKMFEYAHELGLSKRTNPKDDVWTILSTCEIETEDGERTALNELELDLFFLVLTIAGSETTRGAITGGLMALLDHPEQLAHLRSDPAALPGAVEEILRWSSPVSCFARRATRDTEIRGVPIAAGDRVTLWYPSANRDERVFDDPFHFDISRAANPHIAFGGGGPHYCLGASLARREITIFFEELLARTSTIEITSPPVHAPLSIDNPVVVAVKELQVALS